MIDLRFESAALPADTFQILKFDGEEEISHLFRFDLQLISRDPDIDFDSVLEASAKLAITTQDNTRYLHGMLCRFEQCGEWQNGLYEYRAVLVPRLWIMAQSTQNQIFQEMTVPDIIESELDSIQAKGSHPLVTNGLSVDDYEIYTTRNYNEREYTVQYKESDLNFISRLMEHEGIYYYFEHDENREKVVITDTMATEEIAGDSYTEFMTRAATAHYDRNVVYKLNRVQQQIPDSILVKDFNYRSPTLPMQADTAVGDGGIGFITEFGAHFKEPEEGEVLATIRAEEYLCRQNIYSGESNVAAFCCGGLYSLGQHFRREYNQTYMITRVRHSGSQEIESWGNVGSSNYENQFDCIPSGLSYRPERLTPKPKLYGIMNGTIDSELDTGRADLDDQGRYKVMMPFDISGSAPGLASRRIRMAQPYGGGGTGMSFPLVKGTEVIWTCIDGDIDRPIITGSVPNPLNPSVTTAENNTSNVLRTSSGITMGFHDGEGSGSRNSTGGGAGGGLAAQQQYQTINSDIQISRDQLQTAASSSCSEPPSSQEQNTQYPIDLQQQMMADSVDLNGNTGTGIGTSNGKQWEVFVPDYDPGEADQDSYLRMGKAPSGYGTSPTSLFKLDGWFEYTDGDRASITKGSRTDVVEGGDWTQTVSNPDTKAPIKWEKTYKGDAFWRTLSFSHSSKTGFSFGDEESFWGGYKFSFSAGLSTDISAAASFGMSAAAKASISGGVTWDYAKGVAASYGGAKKISSAPTQESTGVLSNKLNVKTVVPTSTPIADTALVATVGTLTGVLAAGATAIGVANVIDGKDESVGRSIDAGVVAGIAATGVITTALTAAAIADVASHTLSPPLTELSLTPASARLGMAAASPAPGIDILPGSITIGCGPASNIIITPSGITITAPKIDLITTAKLGLTSGAALDLTAGAACNIKATGTTGITTPTLDLTKCGMIP